jgi:predicted nucleotidyltransferase
MKSFLKIVSEVNKEREKYFKNFRRYSKIVKKVAKAELKDARVFVFGSVIKGTYTPASDVDILVVSKNMPEKNAERARIKAKIWEKIGIFSPFEIHMASEKEFEWYRIFAKEMEEID